MEERTDESSLPPTDAFSLLGNETRLTILRVLAEQLCRNRSESTLSFAELRKQADVRDASRFNYHLSKLCGQFIAKDEDGYRIRYAGAMIVSAILAGTYTDQGQSRTTELDHSCPKCGEPLIVAYEDERVRMRCDEHGTFFQKALPPGAATDRNVNDLLTLANYVVQQDIERAVRGTCPFCWGQMRTTIPANEADVNDGFDENQPLVDINCERCWLELRIPASVCVVRHPAVVSLYYNNGIDIRNESFLDLTFVRREDAVTFVSKEPFRFNIEIELSGKVLRMTLDDELTVVETERV